MLPSALPASSGSSVVVAGRFSTSQCHQPAPPVGASGSWHRSAKLFVPAGAPVVSLLPPGNVKVRFFVPQDKLATLAIGQKVAIGCDGCGTPIEASVSFVAPQAEFTPRNVQTAEDRSKLVYRIKIEVENTGRQLKSNMPVDAEIVMGK